MVIWRALKRGIKSFVRGLSGIGTNSFGKDRAKTGQMAYSFSLKSLNEGIWHVSLLSGNPDVKFVRYVSLPEEDYLDSIEVGFEKIMYFEEVYLNISHRMEQFLAM